MEQHRVLLIIVSVAVVLAAVVGIGLWLYYPRDDKTDTPEVAAGEPGGFEWEPLDYLQGDGEVPGLEVEAEPGSEPDEFQVTYGVLPEEPGSTQESEQTPAETLSVEVRPTDAVSPGVSETQTAPSDEETPSAPASVLSSAATEASTAVVVEVTPSSSVVSAAPTPSGSSARPSDQQEFADRAYWVQAISSPNRDTVEQARLTLRENQLGSRILTREIDGRTFYRLRIGPFAVRTEAEKFLGWVQAVDSFADAMIFVDYTTPVLAASTE